MNRNVVTPTYKRFQRAEQLRDALEAARSKEFVFSKTSTDGVVPQPQQVDVWMVCIVALDNKQRKSIRQPKEHSVVTTNNLSVARCVTPQVSQ